MIYKNVSSPEETKQQRNKMNSTFIENIFDIYTQNLTKNLRAKGYPANVIYSVREIMNDVLNKKKSYLTRWKKKSGKTIGKPVLQRLIPEDQEHLVVKRSPKSDCFVVEIEGINFVIQPKDKLIIGTETEDGIVVELTKDQLGIVQKRSLNAQIPLCL